MGVTITLDGLYVTLGDTPEVFKALGAKARSMVMPASVVGKATNPALRGHDVSVEDLKNLPALLADPVMVFDSQTEAGALVAMVEATDKSGCAVIVAVHIDAKGTGFHSVNKVASVYGRRSTEEVQSWINGSLRYYNKQKAPRWLRAVGLQLPEANTIKRLDKSVVTDADIVKSSNGDIRLSIPRPSINNAKKFATDNIKRETPKNLKDWAKSKFTQRRPFMLGFLTLDQIPFYARRQRLSVTPSRSRLGLIYREIGKRCAKRGGLQILR